MRSLLSSLLSWLTDARPAGDRSTCQALEAARRAALFHP
jgi:hypothetical protein